MPRIEFEHPEITAWYEKHQEGTSTFDICNDCAAQFTEGAATAGDMDLTDKGYNEDPIPADATVLYNEAEPPSLDNNGLEYDCECCGCRLTDDNYYQ